MVNFILLPGDKPDPLYFPFVPHINHAWYPCNWSKVSWLVRRLSGFRCAWCGSTHLVRCHHMGVPYPNGREGNRCDLHDLRLENLYPICQRCEHMAEKMFPCKLSPEEKHKRREACRRSEAHKRLHVGTGLVPLAGNNYSLIIERADQLPAF